MDHNQRKDYIYKYYQVWLVEDQKGALRIESAYFSYSRKVKAVLQSKSQVVNK